MNEVMVPQQVRRTGIRKGLLEDLSLKILYLHGEMSLVELSEHTCLGLGVIEEIFQFFRKGQLCEVKGMDGSSHRIVASAQGKQRAADLLMLNQYAGPAPVSLGDYVARVDMQSVQRVALNPSDVRRAFCQLVLGEDVLSRVGASVISGTSMFLYGPPGTGKTTIATTIPGVMTLGYTAAAPNQLQMNLTSGGYFASARACSPAGSCAPKCSICNSAARVTSTRRLCK